MHGMNTKVNTVHVCLLTHCLGHLSRWQVLYYLLNVGSVPSHHW